jgi:hypothetical protein
MMKLPVKYFPFQFPPSSARSFPDCAKEDGRAAPSVLLWVPGRQLRAVMRHPQEGFVPQREGGTNFDGVRSS